MIRSFVPYVQDPYLHIILVHIIACPKIDFSVSIKYIKLMLCHEEQVTKERSVSVASHCKDRSAQRPRMTKTTQLAASIGCVSDTVITSDGSLSLGPISRSGDHDPSLYRSANQ